MRGYQDWGYERMKPSKSIQKAREYLIKRGVCSLDGSGEPNVEALFTRLALRLNLRRDDDEATTV